MYTQCSKCETVFKLTPEILRVAGGQVRCGNCGEVFNAVARLSDEAAAFATGESQLDLEARADSILETEAPAQADETTPEDSEDTPPPGFEIARLEVLDWPEEDESPKQTEPDITAAPASVASDEDRSLEFTLPPGELDRIFIESKRAAQPPVPLADAPPPAAGPPAAAEGPAHAQNAGVDALPSRDHVGGFEVPDDVRRDMLSGFEQRIQLQAPARRPQARRRDAQHRTFIRWLIAALVGLLLLLAQLVHQNREWLAGPPQGPVSAVVRALYRALGSPLPAPASLAAYQLRQWGVTGDPDAQGTLRLRASILNAAAELQPYPLLRVTLADRFGRGIAKRDFEPGEYLGRPTSRLLAPGERADATLDILDPGENAEGFEIDVCLRGVDKKISCANDVAVQVKR
ncbi:MAG: hypothetical protein NVS1B6_18230 [Steroidobacteraceae bacterium]